MPHVYRCLLRPEEGVASPRAGTAGSCDLLAVGAGNHLEQQGMLLAAEMSLQGRGGERLILEVTWQVRYTTSHSPETAHGVAL